MRVFLLGLAAAVCASAQWGPSDWKSVDAEILRHFTALVQMDTTKPPGNETKAVEYLREVLESEGIPVKILALDPARANLVARLPGNGSKRPLLVMAHTDTVRVDPAKWIHPPFSALREGGFIYGRGTVDDKDNLAVGLVMMLLLKRLNVPLSRDVIFLAEAGEEASTRWGIEFMVEKHWKEIDAEICLAEGGGIRRRGGRADFSAIQTAEKIPHGVKLTSRGPAGHGSVPLESNALARLSAAVAKVAAWQAPMRLNDTTRYYFERLAALSTPDQRARYHALFDSAKSAEAQSWLRTHEPAHNSMLRTSVSPNIIQGGYQINVIPSEGEATLDVRALPGEDMTAFLNTLRQVINDPAIDVSRLARDTRPSAPPSRLDHEAFRVLEGAARQVYGIPTLPTMSTGATDMAYLRARGVQSYGIGPAIDVEDAAKGFGAHSDQERILEESLYQFARVHWRVLLELAAGR
jgi:acetylornithine deacetylase/succinyl-diaminopimelate desuccinylase-like protein